MAKSEKKRPSIGIEVFSQSVGRGVLKKGAKMFMDWLKSSNPDVFNTLAWIYGTEDGKPAKALVQTTLVTTGIAVETFGDWIKIPEKWMEIIEMAFGDLPGAFSEYFEIWKPTLPPGFTPPAINVATLEKFGTQVRNLLKGWLKSYAMQWKKPVMNFIENLLTDPRQKMFKNLSRLTERDVKKFFDNIDEISVPDRNYLAQCVNLIDELEELEFWARRETTQLKKAISWAKRVENQHLLRRLLKDAYKLSKKHWPTLEQRMLITLHEIDHGLGQVESALEKSNRRRARKIKRQQKARPSTRQRILGDHRLWMFIGFLAFATIIFAVSAISQNNLPPPTVTIVSPTNTDILTTTPVISGEARGEEEIDHMAYRVNHGNFITFPTPSGRHFHWKVKLDASIYGRLIVEVNAYNLNGRVGGSAVEFYRQKPEPPPAGSTTDSNRVSQASVAVIIDTIGAGQYRFVRQIKHFDGSVKTESVKVKVIP